MTADWWPDWRGQVVALVASGPSVKAEEVEALRGRCRVAVINTSYELAPWADMLYAADGRWWEHHREAAEFVGLKVTSDHAKKGIVEQYRLKVLALLPENHIDENRFIREPRGVVARGGNSAFQLVNLMLQIEALRQIWLGFDFQGEHWHGKHPEPLVNARPQTLEKWRKRFDDEAARLAAFGVDVVNASTESALRNYRKMNVAEALAHFGV